MDADRYVRLGFPLHRISDACRQHYARLRERRAWGVNRRGEMILMDGRSYTPFDPLTLRT